MNKAEDIRAIIVEAVQAGRVSAGHTAKDAFKATERRLYALPTLLQKQAEDKDKLEEFLKYGPKERSKSCTSTWAKHRTTTKKSGATSRSPSRSPRTAAGLTSAV